MEEYVASSGGGKSWVSRAFSSQVQMLDVGFPRTDILQNICLRILHFQHSPEAFLRHKQGKRQNQVDRDTWRTVPHVNSRHKSFMVCKGFLPVCGLSFHLLTFFSRGDFEVLMKTNLIISPHLFIMLPVLYSNKSCQKFPCAFFQKFYSPKIYIQVKFLYTAQNMDQSLLSYILLLYVE